jgi:hypothetical protein
MAIWVAARSSKVGETFDLLALNPVIEATTFTLVASGYNDSNMQLVTGAACMSAQNINGHYSSSQYFIVAIIDIAMAKLYWQKLRRPTSGFALGNSRS